MYASRASSLLLFLGFLFYFCDTKGQICTGPMQLFMGGSSTAQPLSISQLVLMPESCPGSADGQINLTLAGGSPGYTYSWYDNPSLNSPTRSGLAGGVYEVDIKDLKNCVLHQTFTLPVPQPLNLTSNVTDAACASATGLIVLTVTGGTAPYQYQLDNGAFQSSNTFAPAPGSYTLTVKDTNGCTLSTTANIQVLDNLAPVFSFCPANIVLNAWGGLCNTPISWALPTATDNCGFVTYTSTHNPGSFFPIGTTTVTYTATDDNNNSETCSFTVTVNANNLNILATPNATVLANAECTDANGWTHYYDTLTNTIVLSVYKNGVGNLGMVGDPTFEAKTATTAGFGSNTAIAITNPPALYVQNPAWFVMNRFWNLTPSNQLSGTPVRVRFYFLQQDKNDIDGSLLGAFTLNQIRFYKINGSAYNPNPAFGHAGIPAAPSRDSDGYVEYLNNPATSSPTNLEWVLGNYGAGYYAEYEIDRFSGGGGGGGPDGSGAFPVELLEFTGYKQNNYHVLEWTTASERNTAFMEVQRMLPGGLFERIGQVPAAGYAETPSHYLHIDETPGKGLNTYRLRMVDKDGSFTYSQNMVELLHDSEADFAVFPNPFSDELEIIVSAVKKNTTYFVLYDEQGKEVVREVWDNSLSPKKIIPVKALSQGVYFYEIRNGSDVEAGKLVKAK